MRRRQFWTLYTKELRENLPLIVVYVLLSVAGMFLLGIQKARLGADLYAHKHVTELVFGLSFIPLGLLPLYIMIQGFLSFRGEWKDDTIFAVLSLPVPGWYVTMSKFLATMTYGTVLSLIFAAGIAIVSPDYIDMLMREIPSELGHAWVIKVMIGFYLLGWIVCALNYLICQVSYLVARLFNKWVALGTGLAYLLSWWVLLRLTGWTAWMYQWLPDYTMETWNGYNRLIYREIISFETAPMIALLVGGAGLAWFGSWLLENILEV